MERKSLKDISWNVTEQEYRQDPALSYSTLARYEREGFNNLDKLFDKIESPSLTFGSAVDTLITGSDEEFNQQFMVTEMDNSLSDTLVLIAKRLFETFKGQYKTLAEVPDMDLISAISDLSWNNHWKAETRAREIKKICASYYGLMYLAGDRTIISSITYNDIVNTVEKLKTSDATRLYFEPNSVFDTNIERFYQLKFKANFNDVNYKCMADELIVFHNEKVVVPIDLKTSSKMEWDFYKSFLDWNYSIQARLYWRIIRVNMDNDPYFKDFKLADYKFIVANRRSLTPLVWAFRSTQTWGELKLGKDNHIILRDPFTIGEELNGYLTNKPVVPNNIELVKPNNLEDWINKL